MNVTIIAAIKPPILEKNNSNGMDSDGHQRFISYLSSQDRKSSDDEGGMMAEFTSNNNINLSSTP